MSGSLEDRITQAMAHLKAIDEAAAKAEGELLQASEAAQSADRSVQVTVGPKGELTDLEFLGGKYKNMTAVQLSAAVLEAANKARTEMASRVIATLDPIAKMVPGEGTSDQMSINWEKIFGSLSGKQSEEQRSAVASRFRDEIHEDDEERIAAPSENGAGARKRAGA
ncbi:YbaB/EbfC family nucleoid-associated protein [Streptomyces sp. NPDC002870]|uniref:YbaB/EbfC family nucleoid-associated protein n=1 Tax=Streptomyces sp. NPDC002870 TaxID=3364666 RepID=UPI0036CF0DC9